MSECPEYRVRLFLSVDLVGSTAFKSSSTATGDALYPDWVERFRQFYKVFPDTLDAHYRESKSALNGSETVINGGPKLWKTIGDEILFCARVTSVRHLSCCITAFMDALDKYGRLLEDAGTPLDVKGSGWVASFPAENIAISVQRGSSISASTDGEDRTEAFENKVDAAPFLHDFLGKGIDTGFRIAKNASTDKLTVSIELAFLLAQASLDNMFTGRFTYHGRETFKGVLKNQPYPVISVDTERNAEKRNVRSREQILTQEREAQPLALHDFLAAFMKYEEIEIPVLRVEENSDPVDPPPSYEVFKNAWKASVTEDIQRDESVTASETPSNQDGTPELSRAITDFARHIKSEASRYSMRGLSDQDVEAARRAASRWIDYKITRPKSEDDDAD